MLNLLLTAPLFLSTPLAPPSGGGERSAPWDGWTLYQPMRGTDAYLIDLAGTVQHTWTGTYEPAMGVYLDENLNLIRTMNIAPGTAPAGSGGAIEKLDWEGNSLWYYEYYTPDEHISHHDIHVMPNGNVLLIAWDFYTDVEAIAQGRNPAFLTNTVFWPDSIVEVQQTGPDTGTIVWEWHVWDHLIQDFDNTKPNYGVVGDHPELIDLNYPPQATVNDFNHFNSVDYHPGFDQILISAHHQNEIWVIDHSTTTAEAAGHTGGTYGKGGDLLYRWGNPEAYDAGTSADRQEFLQHDAGWIAPGQPGEGNILIFNNGFGRPGGNFSSVDEIVPPVDALGVYSYTPGAAFGPAAPTWVYTAPNPTDFFSMNISGCQRLPNGNTLICSGAQGWFFEVDSAGTLLWEHFNVLPNPVNNRVFKVRRYDVCLDPEIYCTTSPNSVGPGALIGYSGSTSVTANDLVLTVTGCPSTQFGLFYYGPNQISIPFGEGVRCAGGGINRLGVFQTNASGAGSKTVDLTNPPQPSGQITVGSHWNFQCWYRDPSGGPSGFNFSDGLSVRFCP